MTKSKYKLITYENFYNRHIYKANGRMIKMLKKVKIGSRLYKVTSHLSYADDPECSLRLVSSPQFFIEVDLFLKKIQLDLSTIISSGTKVYFVS